MQEDVKNSFMMSDEVKSKRNFIDHRLRLFCFIMDIRNGTTVIGISQLLLPPLNIIRSVV